MPESVHASAVLWDTHAVLIRGPSGSGKSRLALALIHASQSGLVRLARLVADDRALLEARHGRLLVRPAEVLAGLIEVRGLGIRQLPYEPVAVVGQVVDLAAIDARRLPTPIEAVAIVAGVRLARLGVAPGEFALPAVLAVLTTIGARGAGDTA